MTLRNFPPADQCSPEDLDAIADLVVRDPRASYDLAGSREHIEALCRRYQALAQDRADLIERDQRHEQARERLGQVASETLDRCGTLAQDLSAAESRAAHWAALAGSHKGELEVARMGIADREDEIAHVNNERQAEVLEAAAQRERADTAESIAEIFEVTARAALTILASGTNASPVDIAELVRAVDGRVARALVRERRVTARLTQQVESMAMLLDEQRQTRELDDQLRSTCRTITGKDLGEVNIKLDEELAAHPDAGPLHHARDQRDHQEDTTP